MLRLLLGFIFLISIYSCKIIKDSAAPVGRFENLGVQLTSSNLQAVCFAHDDDGNDFAYFVVRGRPGHLVGYDLKQNKIVVDVELNGADGAIEMVMSTTNWLYVGASNGHLFRTKPGESTVTDLGLVLPGTAEIMSLEAGANGEIYGGTFPTGKIFKYNEQSGFSDLLGHVQEGESYVRSLYFERSTNALYAGVGSHAHLFRIDLYDLSKQNILPAHLSYREFVYTLGGVEDAQRGNKVFAWVTNATDRDILIYNSSSQQLEQIVPTFDAGSAIKSPSSNTVYFTAQGKLYQSDFEAKNAERIEIMNCNEAKEMRWSDGILQVLTKYGEFKTYDPKTKIITSKKIEVTALPYGIQTLVTGPDGNIWSSGYLYGGNAVYNPKTHSSQQLGGVGQAEGMVVYKNNIHFGVYPKARFYAYDVQQPWGINEQNPKLLGAVAGQDRPFASAALEEYGKIYWGTIPGYGKLGGALIDYNVDENSFATYTEFLQDQAIASLCFDGRHLLIGTTIYGGLGAKPTAKEGKVIIWDVNTNSKISEFVPQKDLTAITYLGIAPDGKLWGFADATIFVMDKTMRGVVKTIKLGDIPPNPSHIWRLGFLDFHQNGYIYGTASGKFFRIDPKTYDLTVLKEGVGLITKDWEGNYYTRDVENLWKYVLKNNTIGRLAFNCCGISI